MLAGATHPGIKKPDIAPIWAGPELEVTGLVRTLKVCWKVMLEDWTVSGHYSRSFGRNLPSLDGNAHFPDLVTFGRFNAESTFPSYF